MSRPNYWWDGAVRLALRNRKKIDPNTAQGKKLLEAIDGALEYTRTLDNGDRRCRLVDLIYFKQSHKYYGAAQVLYVSIRTAQRWDSAFVYEVARRFGFL